MLSVWPSRGQRGSALPEAHLPSRGWQVSQYRWTWLERDGPIHGLSPMFGSPSITTEWAMAAEHHACCWGKTRPQNWPLLVTVPESGSGGPPTQKIALCLEPGLPHLLVLRPLPTETILSIPGPRPEQARLLPGPSPCRPQTLAIMFPGSAGS